MEPMKPMEPMAPMKPMEPMKPMDFGPKWWPESLGEPASSGGQNDVRYAFFPHKQRLIIDRKGEITLYDSADHQVSGVSQQQGASHSLAFTSQKGEIRIDELKKVES